MTILTVPRTWLHAAGTWFAGIGIGGLLSWSLLSGFGATPAVVGIVGAAALASGFAFFAADRSRKGAFA